MSTVRTGAAVLIFLVPFTGLSWFVPTLAFGQLPTASVTGTITDGTGAVVPGAHVIATNVATNAKRDAFSDSRGVYTLPFLEPSSYQLEVTKEGFKGINRSGIVLHVQETARIDFTMDVGSTASTVSVTAETSLVNSETSTLGAVINNRSLLNVPLNDRNTLDLALLSPGVIPSRSMSDSYVISEDAFLVNGARANDSDVLFDGIAATSPEANNDQAVPVLPTVDAIQEFKVLTNDLPAEFGRTGGGVVDFIFKSGTNQLHGDVFEFLRNSALDSNNFFNNEEGIPLAAFRRSQFGFVLGGPVVIPRLINGRNKLFFFGGFEGLRSSSGVTTTATVPTPEERSGNFSSTFTNVGGACQLVQVYDPYSLRQLPGGGFVRTQFTNNTIPQSEIDPVAAKIVSYFPMPNNPGTGCAHSNNFIASNSSGENINQPTVRVDYNPTSKDQFFARLSIKDDQYIPPNPYQNIANPNSPRTTDGINTALSYTRIFNSSVVADFRAGLTRFTNIMTPEAGPNFDMASTLGWTGSAGSFIPFLTGPQGFPTITGNGYATLGTGQQPWSNEAGNSYQGAGSLTKVIGNHTLKTGADFRIFQYAGPNGYIASGAYDFESNFTQGPNPTLAGPASGDPIASLLAGLGTGDVQLLPRVYTSNRYLGLYLQDDYQVTPALTLNLGLRYDVETGRTDRYNHLSWFNFTAPSPIGNLVPSVSNLHGGLEFAGVNGNPKNQFNTDWNNVGPRTGLAYRLNPATVVRAGYGILYVPYSGRAVGSSAGYTGFNAVTTWVSSLDGITPLNRISNPYPNGLTFPTGSSLGLLTALGTSLGATGRDGAFDRTARVGYMQQWNFTVQRQLTRDTGLEVAYAGSKGTDLTDGAGYDLDQLPVNDLALGNALLQSVPNPFYGIIQSGPLASRTTTAGQLLRPYPQFTEVLDFRPNRASSIYHSVQAQLEKRFSYGLQFLVSYTFSKLIDDSSGLNNNSQAANPGLHQNVYDLRADRSISLQDVPQRFVANFVYDLPIGRGKLVGSGWNRMTDSILGGWQANGIVTFSSGLAFLLQNSSNNSNSFSSDQRPNVSGNAKLSGGRPLNDRLNEWFNTAVFSQPPAFTFGNAPRVLPNVLGDSLRNFDLSLFKYLPLARNERVRMQFRTEFFNAFNTPQFAPPSGTFGTGSFGTVTSQQNIPRQIQFGLKILF